MVNAIAGYIAFQLGPAIFGTSAARQVCESWSKSHETVNRLRRLPFRRWTLKALQHMAVTITTAIIIIFAFPIALWNRELFQFGSRNDDEPAQVSEGEIQFHVVQHQRKPSDDVTAWIPQATSSSILCDYAKDGTMLNGDDEQQLIKREWKENYH